MEYTAILLHWRMPFFPLENMRHMILVGLPLFPFIDDAGRWRKSRWDFFLAGKLHWRTLYPAWCLSCICIPLPSLWFVIRSENVWWFNMKAIDYSKIVHGLGYEWNGHYSTKVHRLIFCIWTIFVIRRSNSCKVVIERLSITTIFYFSLLFRLR